MEIKIPFKTLTINHMYFNWGNRRILTKEARVMKEDIAKVVKLKTEGKGYTKRKDKKLSVSVKIHENWLTKKGEVYTKDIMNREKFLTDAIFDAIEVNDKYIYHYEIDKIQDTEEYALVSIKSLHE